jgi:hypothetical protein
MSKKPPNKFSVSVSPTSCPRCKVRFDKGRCGILWHDVIECKDCGHIWVAMDFKEALRWMKMPRKTDLKSEAPERNQHTLKDNTGLTVRPA